MQGGFEPVPTQKFSPRLLYNTGYSSSEQGLNASKEQALLWFKQSRAFDKVDPNKSCAQALCLNSNLEKMTSLSGCEEFLEYFSPKIVFVLIKKRKKKESRKSFPLFTCFIRVGMYLGRDEAL